MHYFTNTSGRPQQQARIQKALSGESKVLTKFFSGHPIISYIFFPLEDGVRTNISKTIYNILQADRYWCDLPGGYPGKLSRDYLEKAAIFNFILSVTPRITPHCCTLT